MNLFKFFKIIKNLKSLRQIKPDEIWLKKTRQNLEDLTGYKISVKERGIFWLPKLAPTVLIVFLVFGIGFGSTIFAAQESLPTEALYPLKLLSERFKSFIIFGDENKINFVLNLAEKRLTEAQELAQMQLVQATEIDTSAISSLAVAQVSDGGLVIVGTINRFENNLMKAQKRLVNLQSKGKAKGLFKIANRLENLQAQQQRLQERLQFYIPQLAEALENAQITSIDVQNEVDKIIVTLNITEQGTTSSTTTEIILPASSSQDRAQKAIKRAEHKIAIVEAKLARFSSSFTPFLNEDDDDEDEDKHESFVPPGLRKKFNLDNFVGQLAFAKRKGKNKVELRFLDSGEVSSKLEAAQKMVSKAGEKLEEAKTAFNNSNFSEAYNKANEAFKEAVKAEGLINRGIGFGPIIFPSPEEPPATTTPVISDISAINISTSSVTINWATDKLADSLINYGTTSSYGLIQSDTSLATSHDIALTNLEPDTTYHYQIISQDEASNIATSSDLTFTTQALSGGDTTAPVISDITANNISTSSATINWSTDEPSTSLVNYGTTSAYGLSQSDTSLATSHSLALTSLEPDTLYHFQVVSQDADSNTATSSDSTFTTTTEADTTGPVISAIGALNIGTSSAIIAWTTDEISISLVEYGTTSSYGLTASSSSLVTSHSIPLNGLSENTLYHFQVSSTDESSNVSVSGGNTFTTATSS